MLRNPRALLFAVAAVALAGCNELQREPEDLDISFRAPEPGYPVSPKFSVQLVLFAFNVNLESLTLTFPGGTAQNLGFNGLGEDGILTATVDASAVPDGPLTLTVTAQGTTYDSGPRTATATLNVVIDRTLLQPALGTLSGFYKLTDMVPLSATFATGASPAQVVFSAGQTTFATLAGGTNGWTGSVEALNIGRGNVAVTATATDALGNTGTATSPPLTIGLLNDTACPTCKGQLQLDVDTPSGDGMLYGANIDTSSAGTVDSATNLGDLRFTAFGGGTTITIAGRTCLHTDAMTDTGEGSDVVLSADGSRVLFRTAPVPTSGAPVCSQLEASAIPPGPHDPQVIDTAMLTGLNGIDDELSSDGTVAVWSPDGANLSGGELGVPPVRVPGPFTANFSPLTSGGTEQWLPLVGGLLTGSPNDGHYYLLTAHGLSPVVTGNPATALGFAGPTFNDYWIPYGYPSADGTTAILVASDNVSLYSLDASTAVTTPVCVPPACWLNGSGNEAAPVLALNGSVFFFEAADASSNPEVGVVNLAIGTAPTFIAGATFAPNHASRARDNSTVPLLVPPASGTSGKADLALATPAGTTTVVASDVEPAFADLHFINYESNWWWGYGPYLFRSYFNRFEDNTQLFAYSTGGLSFETTGSAPIPMAPDSALPFLVNTGNDGSGAIIYLPGLKSVVFQTGVTDYYEPGAGQLWGYTLGSAAAIQLLPPGAPTTTAVYLPIGDQGGEGSEGWNISGGTTVDLRSAKHVAFATASATDASDLEVFVSAIDGTGARQVTKADDSDDATLADRRFGVTSDDTYVWWYAIDGHLYAQPLVGGTNIDLGTVEPFLIVPLPGGVFFATQNVSGTTTHQMIVTTLADPTPQLLGAPMTDYPVADITNDIGIAVNDDQTALYVVNQIAQHIPTPQPAFLVNAQGVTALTTDSPQFVLDNDAGYGFARGASGDLWLLDQHTGATALHLENDPAATVTYAGTGVTTHASSLSLWTGACVPGHAHPIAAGQLLSGGPGYGEDDFFFGARQRYAATYVVGGTTRPGVYVYDTIDGIMGGDN